MENIVQAMDTYFEKLDATWKKHGCKPLYPWDEKFDQSLFLSGPGEDGDAEWESATSEVPADMPPELCPELRDFFGRRRFWRMAGRYKGVDYTFVRLPTDAAAVQAAKAALRDGTYYLGEGWALLATAMRRGNDDLFLMYDQHSGALVLLDSDKETSAKLGFGLAELIAKMEVLI